MDEQPGHHDEDHDKDHDGSARWPRGREWSWCREIGLSPMTKRKPAARQMLKHSPHLSGWFFRWRETRIRHVLLALPVTAGQSRVLSAQNTFPQRMRSGKWKPFPDFDDSGQRVEQLRPGSGRQPRMCSALNPAGGVVKLRRRSKCPVTGPPPHPLVHWRETRVVGLKRVPVTARNPLPRSTRKCSRRPSPPDRRWPTR